MSSPVKVRAASALPGLAIGDALSWSGMSLRTQELPAWLERIKREIEADMREEGITSTPKPFSLNQSPAMLIPAPGDTTEWAAWTATLLLKHQGNLTREILSDAWKRLASSPHRIHGRISVQAALLNIKAGLTAPQSGRFNPHYFDDAALPRAAMIGVAHAGDTVTARALAELDASFTQFEDGIWSSVAVATLFSRACDGSSAQDLVQSVIKGLPKGSLAEITVRKALQGIDAAHPGVMDTAFFLNTHICNQIYSYGNIAHEILASLLVILQTTGGDSETMPACAALVPSAGGSLLALSSALAAVMVGKSFRERESTGEQLARLRGFSIPELKDLDLLDLSRQLGDLAVSKHHGNSMGEKQ